MNDLPPFTIIRSSRRTLGLQITERSEVVVRAPRRTPEIFIRDFVLAKATWIKKHLLRLAENPVFKRETYRDGDELLFKGDLYHLHILLDQHQPLYFKNGWFLPYVQRHRAKELLVAWYRREALRVLTERVTRFSSLHPGPKYRSIRITSARRRWGSCSHDGRLNFSWRIVMAPIFVIDYVVAHELAHLAVPNHSTAFWSRVNKLYPGYEKAHHWLNEHGARLSL